MYLLLMFLLGADAGPFRCGNLLVAPGATTLEVLSKCGEPDFRERISGDDDALEEVWIYENAAEGSQKLLHFTGVTLARIRNAGSGTRSRDNTGVFRCGNHVLVPGATKLDVRKKCGEPAAMDRTSSSEETLRETWLYQRGETFIELEYEGVELQRINQRKR